MRMSVKLLLANLQPRIILGPIHQAFSVKSISVLSISSGLLYAGFYLFTTGLASYYPSTDLSQYYVIPSVRVSFNEMLGWSPWINAYLTNNIILSLPFWALLSTISLAFLLACNVALTAYSLLRRRSCDKKGGGVGLIGALPAFLWAAGCCGPTPALAIVLGSLTTIMLKLVPFLTIASIILLFSGIYFASRSIVDGSRCREARRG